jgi:hypothetical protein
VSRWSKWEGKQGAIGVVFGVKKREGSGSDIETKQHEGKKDASGSVAWSVDAQNLRPPVRSMMRWGSYHFLIFRSLCTFLPRTKL